MSDKLLSEIKRIVSRPKPYKFGFGDVGDVLISYLRSEISEAEALTKLGYLEETYLKDPNYRYGDISNR